MANDVHLGPSKTLEEITLDQQKIAGIKEQIAELRESITEIEIRIRNNSYAVRAAIRSAAEKREGSPITYQGFPARVIAEWKDAQKNKCEIIYVDTTVPTLYSIRHVRSRRPSRRQKEVYELLHTPAEYLGQHFGVLLEQSGIETK